LGARKKKEARYAADVNHQISKQLVEKAKRTKRAIVLEELSGIRQRVRVQKARRAEVGSWSFGLLRAFVEYKAKIAGVPVITVDPKNTSRQCSRCEYTDKHNRRSQKVFQCRQCGFSRHADVNAALNIRSRGASSTVQTRTNSTHRVGAASRAL
jgi:IS605 OrfB family transposase